MKSCEICGSGDPHLHFTVPHAAQDRTLKLEARVAKLEEIVASLVAAPKPDTVHVRASNGWTIRRAHELWCGLEPAHEGACSR